MDGRSITAPISTLNCPSCEKRLKKPILVCETGHSCCGDCGKANSDCKLCLGKVLETRNLALEELLEKATFPCKNKFCRFLTTANNEEMHNQECLFSPLQCPFDGCDFVCLYKELGDHWKEKHAQKPFNTYNGGSLELTPYYRYYNLVLAYDRIFSFHIFVLNSKLYFSVKLWYNVNDIETFTYDVGLFKDEKSKSRFKITDVCIKNDDAVNDDNCPFIPISALLKYVNDGKINFFFGLKRDEPNKPKKKRGKAKKETEENVVDEEATEAVFFHLSD